MSKERHALYFKEILINSLIIYACCLLLIALIDHWLSLRQWEIDTNRILRTQNLLLSHLDIASHPEKPSYLFEEPQRCTWLGDTDLDCRGAFTGTLSRINMTASTTDALSREREVFEEGVDVYGKRIRLFRRSDSDPAVIYLTSRSCKEFHCSFLSSVLKTFLLGSIPFLTLLPLLYFQLKKQLAVYARNEATLKESSQLDFLTGLYNRRGFMACAVREIARAVRNKYSLGFLIIDIDHFKKINDSYGHLAGDHVLKVFASFIRDNFRTEDLLARYGGDEFIVVLPDAKLKDIKTIAERLRLRCEQTPITIDNRNQIRITVSIGGAVIPAHCIHGNAKPEAQVDLMAELADKALYIAKKKRNSITIYNTAMQGNPLGQWELSAWSAVNKKF